MQPSDSWLYGLVWTNHVNNSSSYSSRQWKNGLKATQRSSGLLLPGQAQRARAHGTESFQSVELPLQCRSARMSLPCALGMGCGAMGVGLAELQCTPACESSRCWDFNQESHPSAVESFGEATLLNYEGDVATPVGLEGRALTKEDQFQSLKSHGICPFRFSMYFRPVASSFNFSLCECDCLSHACPTTVF